MPMTIEKVWLMAQDHRDPQILREEMRFAHALRLRFGPQPVLDGPGLVEYYINLMLKNNEDLAALIRQEFTPEMLGVNGMPAGSPKDIQDSFAQRILEALDFFYARWTIEQEIAEIYREHGFEPKLEKITFYDFLLWRSMPSTSGVRTDHYGSLHGCDL